MNSRIININQLMTLMVLFLVASTMLFNMVADAGQNSWAVILISSLIFTFIFAFYYRITHINHFQGLPDIFKSCFGRWLGAFITLIYGIFFFFRFIMVGNGLAGMIQQTLMIGSTHRLSVTMLLLAITFSCFYGLKVIGRSSEIFFAIMIVCLIPFFSTGFSSGVFKYQNLFPVLADGIVGLDLDILRIVFFPYGELIIFLMFFPFVANKDKHKILKRTYIAILISTLLMIAVGSTIVGILGAELARNFNYPFYNAMQLAGLSGFLERLDPLATIIVVLSSYIKAILYLYAAILAFQSLNEKFNYKWVLVIMSIKAIIIAPYLRLDRSEHFQHNILPFYIFPIFQLGIPLMVWIISEIKSYKTSRHELESLNN